MKFSDYIILEQSEEKTRSSRDIGRISFWVNNSNNPEELQKFYEKVLPQNFTENDLNQLNSLVRSFNQKKPLLGGKKLSDYSSIQELNDDIENIELNNEGNLIQGQYDVVLNNDKYMVILPNTNQAKNFFSSTTSLENLGEYEFLRKNINEKMFIIIDKSKTPFDVGYKTYGSFPLRGEATIMLGSPNKKYQHLDFTVDDLGLEKYDILKMIQEFIGKKYSKEIKIFDDPYLRDKFIELNLNRNHIIEKRNRQKLREQDAWFGTEEGAKAYAVYRYLDNDLKKEFDIKDMYDLYSDSWGDYYLTPEREGPNFRVLKEDQMEKEVKNHWEGYIADSLDSFDNDFLENYIDKWRLKEVSESHYRGVIEDEPESYLDESEFIFDDDTTEKIDELNDRISYLRSLLEDPESDENIEEIEYEIIELEEEIDKTKDDAVKIPSKDQIENFIYHALQEVETDPLQVIDNFGLDIGDFIDGDELLDDLVRTEDWDVVASYDGYVDSFKIGGYDYYVYRLE